MKALIVTQYDAPGQLAVTDARRPAPGPGQLLLQVEAAGVNPADYKLVAGEHRDVWPLQFPFVPGLDVAGTVAGLGDGTDGFAVGDKVFGMLFPALGSFAEYALADAGSRLLARRPGGLDPVRAAGLATVGLTGEVMTSRAGLRPGDTVLVAGASGGVGSMTVQLAAQAGAHVIATARHENAAFARSLGAIETIDHTSCDVAAEVLCRHPGGVDALLDAAGLGDSLPGLARAVRDQGTIVSVLATPEPGTLGRSLDVSTVYVNDARPGQLRALADSVASGRLTLPVSATYPLADAPAAITAITGTRKPGKLVITIT
jgi:NADPH:quinone reductase-like Zn-dependent oxidoreductase